MSELHDFIKSNPFYLFFTDDRVQSSLVYLSSTSDMAVERDTGVFLSSPTKTDDLETEGDLFEELGFFFGGDDSSSDTVINSHHPLYGILDAPQIARLLKEDTAITILSVFLQKSYNECISPDFLVELTGFSESKVESALELLQKFQLIKPAVVTEGVEESRETVENAGDVLERLENLVELTREADRDVVSVKAVEEILGETTDDTNGEQIISMTKEEFYDGLQTAVSLGVEEVKTTDSLVAADTGEKGYSLNKSNELAKSFGEFNRSLIRNVKAVHEFCKD